MRRLSGTWPYSAWGRLPAYIASRYLPYTYEEKEVRSLYRFVVERFKPLMDGVL
ncbi:MAG: hypothetical protein QW829_02905 [Candidatus Bathyarchaeia archaeon]